MRRAALAIFVASAALLAFAFSIFGSAGRVEGSTGRHWAAAPLLAFSIVLSMGCLVALTTAAGGRRGR